MLHSGQRGIDGWRARGPSANGDEMNDDRPGETDAGELTRRIQTGDRDAEEVLARRYGPKIEFVLRRHVREPALAADLRQEALMVVIERLRGEGLAEPDKLAAFLYQTAINLARGEARTYFRRNTFPDYEAVERAATADALLADRLERRELGDMIRALLDELGQARDREILRRFYLHEEEKASICAGLDLSPEHFDRVLYRARQRFGRILRTRLGEELTVR